MLELLVVVGTGVDPVTFRLFRSIDGVGATSQFARSACSGSVFQ